MITNKQLSNKLKELDKILLKKYARKSKRERKWKSDKTGGAILSGKISGKTCEKCGSVMLSDGGCLKCPVCMISTGGCGD